MTNLDHKNQLEGEQELTILSDILPVIEAENIPASDDEMLSENDIDILNAVFKGSELETFWLRFQGYASTCEDQVTLLSRFRLKTAKMANECLSLPFNEDSEDPFREAIDLCKTWMQDQEWNDVEFDVKPEYEVNSTELQAVIPFINQSLLNRSIDQEEADEDDCLLSQDEAQMLDAIFQEANVEARWLVIEDAINQTPEPKSNRANVMRRFAIMCTTCLEDHVDGEQDEGVKICNEWFANFSLEKVAEALAADVLQQVEDAIALEK